MSLSLTLSAVIYNCKLVKNLTEQSLHSISGSASWCQCCEAFFFVIDEGANKLVRLSLASFSRLA
jgi:hypothetical protein